MKTIDATHDRGQSTADESAGPDDSTVWAVVLAGGEGIRLRPLTRPVFGDEREAPPGGAMETEIGQAAGTIWRQLDAQHGTTTLGKLKQTTRLSDPLLLMGLGWLAREGKVTLVRRARSLEVSLRERPTG